MREQAIFALVTIVAAGTATTALGTVWLCAKVTSLVAMLNHAAHADRSAVDNRVQDALARLETAAASARDVAAVARETLVRAVEQATVAAELGFQARAASAIVADDLAADKTRADATDGPDGAAADAASKTAPDT